MDCIDALAGTGSVDIVLPLCHLIRLQLLPLSQQLFCHSVTWCHRILKWSVFNPPLCILFHSFAFDEWVDLESYTEAFLKQERMPFAQLRQAIH